MKARPSAQKRRREIARSERKREKARRLAERRAQQAGTAQPDGSEDPDIAGIVPGPQPAADEAAGADRPPTEEGTVNDTDPKPRRSFSAPEP